MFECENCERSFERTITIGEEVRCPYCKSGDIVGGEEKMNKSEKVAKIIKKEFKEGEPVIFLTESGIIAKGNGAEMLSLLSCLIKSLNKGGLPKEALKDCFEMAFKSENDLIDELLKTLEELKGELSNE